MGGNAERDPGVADRFQVGIDKVFLAEMQMLGAGHDRGAPVIIDHELGVGAPDDLDRVGHRLQRFGIIEVLGAQLNRADAEQREARNPGNGINDGIETIRIRHARTGSQ